MLIYHCPPLGKNEQVPYSYRARAYMPSNYIRDLYAESKVVDSLETTWIEPDDVVVLGKKHNNVNVRHLKQRGHKFIFDVADDKWDLLGEIWDRTCKDATAITTTCETLANVIWTRTGRKATVIPDPTERKEEAAKFLPKKDELRIVYFGNESNYRQLAWKDIEDKVYRSFPGKKIQFDWCINKWFRRPTKGEKHPRYVYGMPKEKIEILLRDFQQHYDRIIDWSFEKQGELVRQADLVILPINPRHRMTRSKGNNRPIDAIRQGRFVICNGGCPSYEKLKNYLYIGDITKGIQWAVENPIEVVRRIKKGQAKIKSELDGYTPGVIGERWRKIYHQVLHK